MEARLEGGVREVSSSRCLSLSLSPFPLSSPSPLSLLSSLSVSLRADVWWTASAGQTSAGVIARVHMGERWGRDEGEMGERWGRDGEAPVEVRLALDDLVEPALQQRQPRLGSDHLDDGRQ